MWPFKKIEADISWKCLEVCVSVDGKTDKYIVRAGYAGRRALNDPWIIASDGVMRKLKIYNVESGGAVVMIHMRLFPLNAPFSVDTRSVWEERAGAGNETE